MGILGGWFGFGVVFIFEVFFVCLCFWVGALFGWLLLGVCGCLLLDICSGVVLQLWVCLFWLVLIGWVGWVIGWSVWVGLMFGW